jgi:AraC family transcriptional regulator, transcriptional activator of pobA
MEITGRTSEYFLLETVSKSNPNNYLKEVEAALSIVWNKLDENQITIDTVKHDLKKDQILFLNMFHKVDISNSNELYVIKFNREFYCIEQHDTEIGCKGVLFFGAAEVPMISLEKEDVDKYDALLEIFQHELEASDNLQIEMLQMLLKRFLILSTRIYKHQNGLQEFQEGNLDVIRNFFYHVETHFKAKHTVAEYADIMNKPAKSLSNYFALHYTKSPLQVIQDRIMVEAKRMLLNKNYPVKEIAYELGFEDIQSFSRFFKNKAGMPPTEYKESQQLV